MDGKGFIQWVTRVGCVWEVFRTCWSWLKRLHWKWRQSVSSLPGFNGSRIQKLFIVHHCGACDIFPIWKFKAHAFTVRHIVIRSAEHTILGTVITRSLNFRRVKMLPCAYPESIGCGFPSFMLCRVGQLIFCAQRHYFVQLIPQIYLNVMGPKNGASPQIKKLCSWGRGW